MRRYAKLLAEILAESWRLYPHATAGLLALRVVAVGMTAALALALRAAVDGIVSGDRNAAVLGAAGAAIVFAVGVYVANLDRVVDKMLLDRLGAMHLRPRIEREIAGLPGLEHLERTDLLDRIAVLRGGGWLLGRAAWSLTEAVAAIARLLLLLVLLGTTVTPWLLPLLAFAAVPLWFEERGDRTVSRAETDTAEAYRLQRHLFNLATGPAGGKELRVALAGDELARRQRDAWDEAMSGRFRARLREMAWRLAGWTIFTIGFGAGLGLVVYRTAHGDGTPGDLVLAVTVAVTMRDAIEAALFGLSVTLSGRTLAEPYAWLRDYARAARHPGSQPAPVTLRDGIAFEAVTFTYSGTMRPAVDEVSCRLPAGSVVAVVGEYGSGKTTLVKLLTKLYRPTSGRVTVDGADLADLATDAWLARCAAAFQDFGRFPIRFGDTIGLGDLPALDDDERVLVAARTADASALVDRLPAGLDTQLGRRFDGVELSEGQWQKTALARASMRDEPLLFVLDEPTASLDAPSEHAIFVRYMARARDLAERTGAVTLVVSHRFSTVAGADLILVMDQGRLVEQGTHDDLLAAGGRYADLYSIQATAYAATPANSM